MTPQKILIAALLVMVVSVLGIGGCTFSTYNALVDDEEGIRAQEKQIDIAVDKMVKKIEGQGHVVNNFKSTLVEVLGQTIGKGGPRCSRRQVLPGCLRTIPGPSRHRCGRTWPQP